MFQTTNQQKIPYLQLRRSSRDLSQSMTPLTPSQTMAAAASGSPFMSVTPGSDALGMARSYRAITKKHPLTKHY